MRGSPHILGRIKDAFQIFPVSPMYWLTTTKSQRRLRAEALGEETGGNPDVHGQSRKHAPGTRVRRRDRYSKYPLTSRTKSVVPEDIPQKTEI